VCASYSGEALEDVLSNAFPDIDLEGLTINGSQRIVLVGFALEPPLERMIEWLSEAYGVDNQRRRAQVRPNSEWCRDTDSIGRHLGGGRGSSHRREEVHDPDVR
jgi:hypothetical protein